MEEGSIWRGNILAVGMLLAALASGALPAFAQLNTRLLLTTGTEVPGHGGLAFGPFLSLAMNGNQEIIFLTSLRSPRAEMRAVVRSTGVSFSVVAFQGLLGPFPRTTYDTFSAPSMNDSGVMAFTATLVTDQADVPRVAVVRQEGAKPKAVATNLDAPPGQAGAKFEEFSAPLVFSDGSVLFGARWSGKGAGSGLFLWSPRGLQALQLPAGLQLGPKELLEPFFFGHDEAGFLRRGFPRSCHRAVFPRHRHSKFSGVATSAGPHPHRGAAGGAAGCGARPNAAGLPGKRQHPDCLAGRRSH